MVPADNLVHYKSNLKTVLNIIDNLKSVAMEKQQCILEQNWNQLSLVSEKNQDINQHFENTMESLSKDYDFNSKKKSDFIVDHDIVQMKLKIKQKILELKEIENVNIRMLKDHFYIFKEKLAQVYGKTKSKDTYTKDLKKNEELWDEIPVVLNKLV